MLKKKRELKFLLLLTIFFIAVTSCSKDDNPVEETELQKKINEYNQSDEGLKDFYTLAGYFDMGVAIPASFVDNQDKVNLIKRHFNSVTAENDMKWSNLQPVEGTFTFTNADKIVTFAQANGMKVRGHCLCWHNQVPAWIFKDGTSDASKELVLQRLRTHITTVVSHFKGKVYAWDVVNEAIDDGSSTYRASKWYTICGEDYIFEAFEAARAADPDALLFYNDYTAIDPTKRDKIYDLLVKLKAQDLVDGMGLQGHWNISYPANYLINDALNKYKSLGLQIHITEMDVSVYTSNSDPESAYTDALAQQQTIAYGRYFLAFRTFKEAITGITFWGLADDYTWLDNFPVTGRKNYPLLFDENLDPKPAYFEIIDF
jgi:endo-1,4-beta-xylanase